MKKLNLQTEGNKASISCNSFPMGEDEISDKEVLQAYMYHTNMHVM